MMLSSNVVQYLMARWKACSMSHRGRSHSRRLQSAKQIMSLLSVFRISNQCRIKAPLVSFQAWRCYAQLHQESGRSSFGIAFDIDGVVLRGRVPIGGSPLALKKLYDHRGALKIPFLFLTNGGGVPECRRASDLSKLLGVTISAIQVVQGHSSFKNLVKMYENELIIATGKGEPALVMLEYGFKKVLSLEEYASHFNNIEPVAQYKAWMTDDISSKTRGIKTQYDVSSDIVKATFVVSDPVDWGRDIQVLCDILKCGGVPGQWGGDQPALYFAADDLQYQSAYPSERLGMGAFRIALENVFNRIHYQPLQYTCFGKPNPFVYKNAEGILNQINDTLLADGIMCYNEDAGPRTSFKTLYMIGDNPLVDIKGARKAGYPWFSILTKTGVFRGEGNDVEFPADFVVDTVAEAVDYILKRECCV